MNVKIVNIICSVNFADGQKYVLNCDKDIHILQENQDPQSVALDLCNDNLLLSSNWISPMLSSVYSINNVVNIVYVCVVPFDITLKDSTSWKQINNDLFDGINYKYEFDKILSLLGS